VGAVETRPEVRATAKWVRSSARKTRLITDLIRGRSVPEARTILAFSERAVAREVEKVLRSAVANAEANNGWNGDQLVVVTAYADEGPTLKRWRARARGRVARIRKRTCHITVVLAQGVVAPQAPPPPAVEDTTAAESPPEAAEPKTRAPRRRKTEEATA
jgi:large subunit ribosomal protein L22